MRTLSHCGLPALILAVLADGQEVANYGSALKRSAGWTWNQHGHYDSHIPEVFPRVRFMEKPAAR